MQTQSNKLFAGNIWKFGCNWKAYETSFYNFIKDEQIVIGRENWRYSVGDLVAITEGFSVKAIVMVEEEPKAITENSSYKFITEKYNIAYEDATIYAKAEWCQLPEEDIFQYQVQRGAARVRKPDIKETVLELWNRRNK